jgi:predicted flavoprotein YhiN
MKAEEILDDLLSRHTKLQVRNILESKLLTLDTKMNKYGFTTEDLEEERIYKKAIELLKTR